MTVLDIFKINNYIITKKNNKYKISIFSIFNLKYIKNHFSLKNVKSYFVGLTMYYNIDSSSLKL